MPSQPVLELFLRDRVRLRRSHACGGNEWLVDRLGADIGLTCATCGRHALLDRRHLEARIVAFIDRGEGARSAAPAPAPEPDRS